MVNVTKRNLVATLVLIITIVTLLVLQIVILVLVSQMHTYKLNPRPSTQAAEDQHALSSRKCEPTANKNTACVAKDTFGTLVNGANVDRYTLSNSRGMAVKIITYGAIITSIEVPDRNGRSTDITLGYDDIRNYERNNTSYFGAIVGRVANRIGRGRFTLDNLTYELKLNDGDNHLHGGPNGWSKRLWQASVIDEGLILSLVSEDGDENYPGEVTANVTYRLTEDSELVVRFQATTKKRPTPINLTSHPYFNLAGEGTNNINDQSIAIFADYYLKSSQDLIPTGEISHVRDTLLDLRQSTCLGDVLPLFNGSGYDHTFCVRGPTGRRLAARAYHPISGRQLEVYTDQPGIQFYTGNFLDVRDIGKRGHSYPRHSGFCLETHNYPDAVNHANFPDSILREGSTYEHWAWYKFSVIP